MCVCGCVWCVCARVCVRVCGVSARARVCGARVCVRCARARVCGVCVCVRACVCGVCACVCVWCVGEEQTLPVPVSVRGYFPRGKAAGTRS